MKASRKKFLYIAIALGAVFTVSAVVYFIMYPPHDCNGTHHWIHKIPLLGEWLDPLPDH